MKFNKIPIFLMLAFLVMLSPAAFADAGGNSAKDALNEILNYGVHLDPSTDKVEYFQIWLSYIFGTFIYDVQTGGTGTVSVLSSALGFVNLIALMFGFVMISYVFAGGALNSAHSGEVLGKNWSSVWMPIRTSLGLGFIMPAPAFGAGVLSFAQVAIIWLIIFGSNAGSFVWRNTVSDMVTYGVYGDIRTPSSGNSIPNLTKIMVCLDHKAKYADFDNKGGKYIGATVHYRTPTKFETLKESVKSGYQGGGSSATKTEVTRYKYTEISEPIEFVLQKERASTYSHKIASLAPLIDAITPNERFPTKIVFDGCGSIENIPSLASGLLTQTKNAAFESTLGTQNIGETKVVEYGDSLKKVYKRYHNDYLVPAISATWSTASQVGSILNGDPLKASNLVKTESDASAQAEVVKGVVKNVSEGYIRITNNYEKFYADLKKLHIQETDALRENDMSEFGRGGWAGAGIWFIKIGQLDRTVASASYDATISFNGAKTICDKATASSSSKFFLSRCEKANQKYNASVELLDHSLKAAQGESNLVKVNGRLDSAGSATTDFTSMCTSVDDCDISNGSVDKVMSSVAQSILNILTITPMGDASPESTSVNGGFFSATGLQNPFNTLQTIGTNLNNLAMASFAGWGAVKFFASALDGAVDNPITSSFGAKGFSQGALAIVSVMGYALIPMLVSTLSAGFVMAYMIPFLPILAWINMMIGYLITVIEAVTAAPLAVIQLLTPEGQGILGSRLERAMQLLIVVMIKPTLMIIGLLSAIVISSIAFSIFNEFFWQSSILNLGFVGIVDAIALVIIYSTSALALTKLVVSIMYTLPNHILEWFAGGAARAFGEESSSQALEHGGKAISGAFQSAGSGIKHKIAANRQEKIADRQEAMAREREAGDQSRYARQMQAMGHGNILNDNERNSLL